MERTFNVPTFIRVTDSIGNDFHLTPNPDGMQFIDVVQRGSGQLNVGQTLSIEVEVDPSFKQIIPYVVFRSGDLVFCYTRGKTQGEARLHRLRSMGVGGHVSEEDARGGKTLDAYESAFNIQTDDGIDLGPYDYNSIMHYARNAFGRDG